MIQETEEAIMNRLKPLLDRAEVKITYLKLFSVSWLIQFSVQAIVSANTKHEEMKKRSLKHQLTDLTARTVCKYNR